MQCAGRSGDIFSDRGQSIASLLGLHAWRENGLPRRLGLVMGAWIRPERPAMTPPATPCSVSRCEDRKSSALPVAPSAPSPAIRWSGAAAQMMKTEIEVKVLTKDYPSSPHDCLLLLPMMSERGLRKASAIRSVASYLFSFLLLSLSLHRVHLT